MLFKSLPLSLNLAEPMLICFPLLYFASSAPDSYRIAVLLHKCACLSAQAYFFCLPRSSECVFIHRSSAWPTPTGTSFVSHGSYDSRKSQIFCLFDSHSDDLTTETLFVVTSEMVKNFASACIFSTHSSSVSPLTPPP